MMGTGQFLTLNKLGFYLCDVPEEIITFTKKEAARIISSNFTKTPSYKHGLVGTLEHEYRFTSIIPALNAFFKEVVPDYLKNFEDCNGHVPLSNKFKYLIPENKNQPPYVETPVWINFQKKYEHNPVHIHSGDLSFVYWVQIPYDLEEEKKLPNMFPHADEKYRKHSTFSFLIPLFGPSGGGILPYQLNVDKTWEGKLIIFPAWLSHCVTPFYTSDEYRISVAGNLYKVNV